METKKLYSAISEGNNQVADIRERQRRLMLQIIRNVAAEHGVVFERIVLEIEDGGDDHSCYPCCDKFEPPFDSESELFNDIFDELSSYGYLFDDVEIGHIAVIERDDSSMEFKTKEG